MKGLGIPYMGSKRKLAPIIIDFIVRKQPYATKLYDIFGGGGAITFVALQNPQFTDGVVWNDIDRGLANLMNYIKNAKDHKKTYPELYKLGQVYEDKLYEWVSREEFFKNKYSTDWYGGFVKTVWSFGNKGKTYLFGKNIEEVKRLGHMLAVYGRDSDLQAIHNHGIKIPPQVLEYNKLHHRRRFISGWAKRRGGIYELVELQQLQQLERLQQLEQLQQLERLQQLEQLQQSHQPRQISCLNYKDIDPKSFEPYSVVYLDPPYENTADYKHVIDHSDLYEWIAEIDAPVYLSSYESPLKKVLAMSHRTTLPCSRTKEISKRIEWLFWNEKQSEGKSA